MTAQILTPTPLVPDGAGLDLTALLATPTQTTLQFTNSGREFLLVSAGAASETVTVDVGITIGGQTVANYTAVSLTNTHISAFGPFHAYIDQSGTQTAQIVLSTVTSIMVALVQFTGVS